MAQHDFSIANQTFPATRTDLNNALEALATLSSGATEPTTTYADMLWYDSGNNILKMRSEADDAWINVGYLCQSTNKFCILDDTNVVNTSGTQTGTIGDQATSAWEAGTSTTESLVSPAKVKAASQAHAVGDLGQLKGISAGNIAVLGFGGISSGGNASSTLSLGQLFQAGSVRVSASFYSNFTPQAGSGTARLAFLKNGVEFANFTTTETSPQLREANTSVAFGDALEIKIQSLTIHVAVMEDATLKTSGVYIWPLSGGTVL